MLISNWRKVLRKAWSLRFAALAAVMSGVELILPMFPDMFPRGVFAGLSFLSAIAAFVARFIAQKELGNGK